jgi:hypothetical protein
MKPLTCTPTLHSFNTLFRGYKKTNPFEITPIRKKGIGDVLDTTAGYILVNARIFSQTKILLIRIWSVRPVIL